MALSLRERPRQAVRTSNNMSMLARLLPISVDTTDVPPALPEWVGDFIKHYAASQIGRA
jgi:hypothetical protein